MAVKKLNIRPDTGVYATYKRISYEPSTAIAEFVDNSTQSFYDHKEELFNTKYYKKLVITIKCQKDDSGDNEIVITDNAFGMNYEDFQRALILNKPPKNTKGRNEFGMGLKVAATWFSNYWIVESKALNEQYSYKAVMDIDYLQKYKNSEIDVIEEKDKKENHYTKITLKKLNKNLKKVAQKKIIELLSSIYRNDLRSGCIEIYYNDEKLLFNDPKVYVDKSGKVWKKDIAFKVPYKDSELSVKGFIAIRETADTRRAGFTLMRRGRVILGGQDKNYRPNEIFGASNSYVYQRLFGELNMDDWPVTQAKDNFDWADEGLEESFIEYLQKECIEYKSKATKLRKREEITKEVIKDELKKSLEESPHFSNVSVELTNNNQQNILNRKEDINYDEEFETSPGVMINDDRNIAVNFMHNNKHYNYLVIFSGDNNNPWLVIKSNDNNQYELIINTNNKFFYPYINKNDFLSVLAKMSMAIFTAELESYNTATNGLIEPCEIRILMGKILEEIC